MSVISQFFSKQVIAALESELIKHEPEIQQALMTEFTELVEEVIAWAKNKLELKEKANEEGR